MIGKNLFAVKIELLLYPAQIVPGCKITNIFLFFWEKDPDMYFTPSMYQPKVISVFHNRGYRLNNYHNIVNHLLTGDNFKLLFKLDHINIKR